MNCKDFNIYGSAYIDNMLSEEEKLEFENHINSCHTCRLEFENLKIITESINDIEEVELPINFSSELRNKLENETIHQRKNKSLARTKILSSIVAGLLIIIASVSLLNNSLTYRKKTELNNSQISDAMLEEDASLEMASEEPKVTTNSVKEEKSIEPRIMSIDKVEEPKTMSTDKIGEEKEEIAEDAKENNTEYSMKYNEENTMNVSEEKKYEELDIKQGNKLMKKSKNNIIKPVSTVLLIAGIGFVIYKLLKR